MFSAFSKNLNVLYWEENMPYFRQKVFLEIMD